MARRIPTFTERKEKDALLGYVNRNTRLKIKQIKEALDNGYSIPQVFELGVQVMRMQIKMRKGKQE